MTEQEIIKRLKENKKMGTIYFFLPEDVRDYLLKHKHEEKTFLVFDTAINEWRLNPQGISCIDELIYALPDDYKPKKPFKPRWEEDGIELYSVLDRVSCWCCANKNLKELKNIYIYAPILEQIKRSAKSHQKTVQEELFDFPT